MQTPETGDRYCARHAVIICGKCEHEWAGPGDGACPRCGNDCEDHVVLQ